MRLDRCLANSGYGSRAEVKGMIRQGRVQLDGQVVLDCGQPVDDAQRDLILVDGLPARLRRHIHLMLHKPAGLVTAMEDPRLPTIAGLIPPALKHAGLFPVGRLDRDATGLLLLTNDGTLGHRLASPHWEIWKTYEITINGRAFDADEGAAFAAGLHLPDGQICRPAELTILGPDSARLSIHEGKYHQVKRMMLGTGRRVVTLHRRSIGDLELDKKLAPGESRELFDEEIIQLYRMVALSESGI